MLVITRSPGQSLVIGDDIEIIVSEVNKDKVKISINAPRDIKIMRKELLEISKENEDAAKTVANDVLNDLVKSVK